MAFTDPGSVKLKRDHIGRWLPVVLGLAIGLGCSRLAGSAAPLSEEPARPSIPTEVATRPPGATSTPAPSATPQAGYAEPRFTYQFTTNWDELPDGESVVFWDMGNPGTLSYYSWEVGPGDMLVVLGAREGSYWPEPASRRGTRIALRESFAKSSESWVDVIDLKSKEVRGYRIGCSPGQSIGDVLLGPEYLAYECDRNGIGTVGYRFVPLEAPDQVMARPLPLEFDEEAGNQGPRWLSGRLLYMFKPETEGTTACVSDVVDWDPTCIRVPYWLGELSPDGQWIEARNADNPIDLPERPDEVGVLSASCVLGESSAECEPSWKGLEQDRRRVRLYGTWSPNSDSVFLLQGVDCTQKYEGYSSNVWRLEVETGELALVGTIPNRPASDEPYLTAIWSPDGSEVLVNEGQSACLKGVEPWHAFSVETGRLRLLLEDAGIPLAVLEKPQPAD